MTEDQVKEDFYKKTTIPPTEKNFIKNKDVAHELANIENTLGRDKAFAREQELKRLHETGLTDQERNMIAFNEGLVNKYPHAFSVDIGKDGQVYYELKPVLDKSWQFGHMLSRTVLSQDGILLVCPPNQKTASRFSFDDNMKNISTAELFKRVQDVTKIVNRPLGEERRVVYIKTSDHSKSDFILQMLNPLGDREELQGLKEHIQKVESDHLQFNKNETPKPTVADALSKF